MAVSLLDLQVAIVGEIPQGFPDIGVPHIGLEQWLALIPVVSPSCSSASRRGAGL